MNEDPRKQEVADRMARVVGLPIASVNSMISDFTDEDLTHLHGLDDNDFKRESVRLVNKAQQRQFSASQASSNSEGTDTPISGIKIAAGGPPPPPTPPQIKTSDSPQRKLVIPKAAEHEDFPSEEKAPSKQPGSEIRIPTMGTSGLKIPSSIGGSGLKTPDSKSLTPPPAAPKPLIQANDTTPKLKATSIDDVPTLKATAPPADGEKPVRKLRIAPSPASEPQQGPNGSTPAPTIKPIQPAEPAPTPVGLAKTPAGQAGTEILTPPSGNAHTPPKGPTIAPPPASPKPRGGDSQSASGIQPVEPAKRKPLQISKREEEQLEKEFPQTVRKTELSETGERQQISEAFKAKDDSSGIDKKALPFIIGVGVASLIVVCLIGYAAIRLLSTPEPIAQAPIKKPNSGQVKPQPKPEKPETFPAGEWAWKGEGKFKETFENKYLLSDKKGQAFTIEMWVSVHKPSGIKDLHLTTVGEKFTLGIRRYLRRPVVYFNVPDSHHKKTPPQANMPTGSGWIHMAGVYDPAQKTLSLFVNGELTKSLRCSMDPLLSASVYILEGDLEEESYVLIDEIRMTAAAIYKENFEPERTFEPGPDTIALLHMEKNDQGAIPDHAQQERNIIYLFPDSIWEKVDSENYELAIDKSKILEKEMFETMEKKLSANRFEDFKEFWAGADAETRAKLLEEFEAAKNQKK